MAQLAAVGRSTVHIRKTVEDAIANIAAGSRSFVIYGEPQSGKTEMMIALTAKLLDNGHRIIVVLLNDNVELLTQNLGRFRASGLNPSPTNFTAVLHEEISLSQGEWVIFSKKNGNDLTKIVEKLRSAKAKRVVVIDDEADYATPNSKINKGFKTPINALVGNLIGDSGFYVGVTATPARLDLNHTFDNEKERWVLFEPHEQYIGRQVFFPVPFDQSKLEFRLKLMPEDYDAPKFLRRALFRFFVTVAHLNTAVNAIEQNYSMLIHTSGVTNDHSEDFKQVLLTFEVLGKRDDARFERFTREIWDIAEGLYPGQQDVIIGYIISNIRRSAQIVLNSTKRSQADQASATSPQVPFTIVIGGNIVSRGVTFDYLLSMFFTRDVKHKVQQDTYIQRARMFGNRGAYLPCFELTIPRQLYLDWHRCVLFHGLALEAIKTESKSPVWIEDKRISVAASNSIDRANVNLDRGEMSFGRFKFDAAVIDKILARSVSQLSKLKAIHRQLGEAAFPEYLLEFVEGYLPTGDSSIVIHEPFSIENYTDGPTMSRKDIWRRQGFIGSKELAKEGAPNATHHFFFIYYNRRARVFYKATESLRFLKS